MGHYDDAYAYDEQKRQEAKRNRIDKALALLRESKREGHMGLTPLIDSHYEILEALLMKERP